MPALRPPGLADFPPFEHHVIDIPDLEKVTDAQAGMSAADHDYFMGCFTSVCSHYRSSSHSQARVCCRPGRTFAAWLFSYINGIYSSAGWTWAGVRALLSRSESPVFRTILNTRAGQEVHYGRGFGVMRNGVCDR